MYTFFLFRLVMRTLTCVKLSWIFRRVRKISKSDY